MACCHCLSKLAIWGVVGAAVCIAVIRWPITNPPARMIPVAALAGELESNFVAEPIALLELTGSPSTDAQAVLAEMQRFHQSISAFRVRQVRSMSSTADIASVVVGCRPNQLVLRYENWYGALAFVSDGQKFRVSNEHAVNQGSPGARRFLEGVAPSELAPLLQYARQLSVVPGTHAFPELEFMALLPFVESPKELLAAMGWGTVSYQGIKKVDGHDAHRIVCSGRVCQLREGVASGKSRPTAPAEKPVVDENPLYLWIDAVGPPVLRKCEGGGFEVTYKDWVFDPKLADGTFRFPPTHGYTRAEFEFPPSDRWVGRPAPATGWELLDGSPCSLSDHRGKVVVLDFWATWCRPCLAELPIVAEVVNSFPEDEVTMLAVTGETDLLAIQETLEALDLQVNVAIDRQGESSKFGVVGIPHLVVIDSEGIIRGVHVGMSPYLKETLHAELYELIR